MDRLFPGQFVLSEQDNLTFNGWVGHRLNRWTLYCAPGPRVRRLLDRNGTQVGWFLGEGIAADGAYVRDGTKLPFNTRRPAVLRNTEQWIEGIAGRYLVIFDTPDLHRIYGDPVGDFACVFNPQDRLVAPIPALATLSTPVEHPWFTSQKVLGGGFVFSLQQTPDANVLRALPNHYLDLDSFACVRHWPRKGDNLTTPDTSWKDNADRISDRLEQIVGALADNTPVILPVSGGKDSRNLIGAARPHLSKIAFGFAWQFHKMSKLDADIGETICTRLGVPFRRLTYVETTPEQRDLYLRRTGFTHVGTPLRIEGTRLQLPPGHVALRGNVMEILRANQWNRSSMTRRRPATSFAMRRLLINRAGDQDAIRAAWQDRYRSWAESLPKSAWRRQLDLQFIEHLLPNSLGIRHFGTPDNFVMNPFSDRALIQLAMQIDPDVRKDDLPNHYLLNRNCADLGDIPMQRDYSRDLSLLPPP